MKTIEQAAKEYALRNSGMDYEYKAIKHFTNGVEFAQRWISVEEELPEEGIQVLVKTTNLKYAITERYTPKDCSGKILGPHEWKGSNSFKNSITHWRPIEIK